MFAFVAYEITKNVDDSKAATSGDHKNPGSITENTYTMYACLLFQDKAALITITLIFS